MVELAAVVADGGTRAHDLDTRVVELLLRIGELGLGVVELGPAVQQLLLLLAQLGLGVGDLAFAVRDFLFAVGDLLGGVLELDARVLQLLARVLQLLLRVVDFLLGVGNLVRALLLDRVVADLAALTGDGLDAVRHLGDVVLVAVVKADVAVGRVAGEVRHRIDVQRKRALGDEEEEPHVAVADVRRAAVKVQVPGVARRAHDREGVPRERVEDVVLAVGVDGDRVADGEATLGHVVRVQEAFVRALGHPPLRELREVDSVAEGLDAHHRVLAVHVRQRVHGVPALRAGDALDLRERGDVVLREAQLAQHAQVHHVLRVVERVGGELHVRLCGAHARVKRHAQRHDEQDGQVAVEAAADLPEEILD